MQYGDFYPALKKFMAYLENLDFELFDFLKDLKTVTNKSESQGDGESTTNRNEEETYSDPPDLEDPAGADRWCKEGGRRFPKDPYFTECQFEQMAIPGQTPDVTKAWQILEQDVALWSPTQRDFRRRRDQLFVAFVLVNAGLKDSADRVARRSRADASVDPNLELIYFESMLRNRLGDRDESLRLLAQYLAANPQDRMTIANDQSWWWRGVRDDPRFKQLVGLK